MPLSALKLIADEAMSKVAELEEKLDDADTKIDELTIRMEELEAGAPTNSIIACGDIHTAYGAVAT